jgi:hypothetical protein
MSKRGEPMKDKIVLEEVRVAKAGVIDAESDLATLMRESEIAPRAEKTTISEALRSAFLKLRDAREHLGRLETLISSEDD